jgi:hypothetical protein
VTDGEEARRQRARRLREEIARLREGEPREPSSPRDFVEPEPRRKDEPTDEEEDAEPGAAPPD